jgi:hypothetical protein
MPRAANDLPTLLLNVAQSMNSVGYSNPNFVAFVEFLLQGRPIRASFLSGDTPPGAIAVALDIMVVCSGPTGGNASLMTITARRTGVVEWDVVNLRHCVGAGVSVTGNLAVASLAFLSAGTAQIAAPTSDEGDLNLFALDVARAAGF